MDKIKDSKTIIIALVIVVAGVAFSYFNGGLLSKNLTKDEATKIAIDFINQSIEEGFTANLIESTDEGKVYGIHLKIGETEYKSYITKDGKFLFPNGFILEENQDQQQEQNNNEDSSATADLSSFAQCLTDNELKFYGAWWCPHCADQKDLFGDAMQYINYIECEKEPQVSRGEMTDVCTDAGISNFPTWESSTGEQVTGFQSLEQLSQLSGCSIDELK